MRLNGVRRPARGSRDLPIAQTIGDVTEDGKFDLRYLKVLHGVPRHHDIVERYAALAEIRKPSRGDDLFILGALPSYHSSYE